MAAGYPSERGELARKNLGRNWIMWRSLGTALIAVTVFGCVSTKYTLVNPSGPKYDPIVPEEVWIVTAETELDTLQYVRIAIIEATGSGEFTDQTGMLTAIRKRAGELGANAVLLPNINEPGAGAKVAAAVFGTGTQRKGSAVAIRILGRRPGQAAGIGASQMERLPIVRISVG